MRIYGLYFVSQLINSPSAMLVLYQQKRGPLSKIAMAYSATPSINLVRDCNIRAPRAHPGPLIRPAAARQVYREEDEEVTREAELRAR